MDKNLDSREKCSYVYLLCSYHYKTKKGFWDILVYKINVHYIYNVKNRQVLFYVHSVCFVFDEDETVYHFSTLWNIDCSVCG